MIVSVSTLPVTAFTRQNALDRQSPFLYVRATPGHRTEKGESTLKKHRIILGTILVVLALGIVAPQFAQEPSPDGEKAALQKHHALCIGLVRIINTDEVTEVATYGSYSSWENLLAHQPEFFNRWLARPDSQQAKFADAPDILPGFRLRLNIHADGKGYDLRLQDTTGEGWAAFSDESGVIWEGEPLH